MGSSGIALISLREIVKEFNIACQSHPDMRPFDQVVTEYPPFRESSRKHTAEGAHIVDALALVGPFSG